MTPNEQKTKWREELLLARRHSSEDGGFEQFMKLAEESSGGGLYEAKALASTITSVPEDNGEGEAVLALLAGFKPDIQVQAIIEEIPRLLAEHEDEWADSLVETLARFNALDLIQVARSSTEQVRFGLRTVLLRLGDQAKRSNRQDISSDLIEALT